MWIVGRRDCLFSRWYVFEKFLTWNYTGVIAPQWVAGADPLHSRGRPLFSGCQVFRHYQFIIGYKSTGTFLVVIYEEIYPAQKAIERLNTVAPQVHTEIIPDAGHDLTMVQTDLVNKKSAWFPGRTQCKIEGSWQQGASKRNLRKISNDSSSSGVFTQRSKIPVNSTVRWLCCVYIR